MLRCTVNQSSRYFDVHESVRRDTTMKITNKMHYIDQFIIPSQLYMLREMFSLIIRSIWLYLQYLVVFTQVAAGTSRQQLERYILSSGTILFNEEIMKSNLTKYYFPLFQNLQTDDGANLVSTRVLAATSFDARRAVGRSPPRHRLVPRQWCRWELRTPCDA
jgi:hypothetical protein